MEFADLGLSDTIVDAARAADLEHPTPLQAAAVQVLRRGGNVMLHASSGAGVTAAFGLPLIDRLAASEAGAGARALVLVPTQERAERLADSLFAIARAAGVSVRAVGSGWRVAGADVLVTTPRRALEGVQTSELKLDSVQTFVVNDAAGVLALGGGSALETLAPLVPRDAQRVVTSADLTSQVEQFVEAHARRALTVPARPAAPPRKADTGEALGQIGYMVVDEAEKAETVARLLETVTDAALVYARTARRAERVVLELSRRGIPDEGQDIRVIAFDEATAGTSAVRVISADVPFSADELSRFHATGGTVLVTAGEVAHLKRIAAIASFTLKHRRARTPDASELDGFRAAVRVALDTEDLDAQMLVLEPLFADRAAEEVAAALGALLRRRAPAVAAGASPGVGAGAAGAAVTSVAGAPPSESTTGAFTRLFISLGSRDNIRAGDLVGAITGEANIKGDQVGRIDIRESFSVVEIASSAADRVIRALNGTTMRGRSLRVDYDRKGSGGGAPGRDSRGPRAPRGDGPRPPRGDAPRAPRGDAPRTPRGDSPRGPRPDRPRGRTGGPPGKSRPDR